MKIHDVLRKHFGIIAVSGDRRTEIANVFFTYLGRLVNEDTEVSDDREKLLHAIILQIVMSLEVHDKTTQPLQLSRDAVTIATLVNSWR